MCGNRSGAGCDGPGVGGGDGSKTTYVVFPMEHPASGVGMTSTGTCSSGVLFMVRHFLVGGWSNCLVFGGVYFVASPID